VKFEFLVVVKINFVCHTSFILDRVRNVSHLPEISDAVGLRMAILYLDIEFKQFH